MECWDILGINETNDESKIKRAYIEKLKQNHPEENPEGFKRIRKAYDDALKSIVKVEMDIEESPIEEWLSKIRKIYSNFIFRVNVDKWKELFDEDICFQIDSRDEVCENLLIFLMENYYIPYEVWKLIDKYFFIRERETELKEKFDNNFINFVINNINNKGSLDYNYFSLELNKNYDLWISLYYQLKQQIDNFDEVEDNNEEIESNIDKIEKLCINNPCLNVLLIQYMVKANKVNEAIVFLENVGDDYDWDTESLFWKARVYQNSGDLKTAKSIYKKVLGKESLHFGSIVGIAECLYKDNKLEEALEYYEKAKEVYNYDGYIYKSIKDIKDKLIEVYEDKAMEGKQDDELQLRLAWLYLETENIEGAKRTLKKVDSKKRIDIFQCYDLKGRIEILSGKYKKALKIYSTWLDEDDDAGVRKAFIYMQIGFILEKMEQYNLALSNYNKALELDNRIEYVLSKLRLFIKLEKYSETIRLADQWLAIKNNIAELYEFKAEALYNCDDYVNSMENCMMALGVYPYSIQAHLIIIKIYYASEKIDLALEIIKKLEDLKIDNIESKIYKIKCLNRKSKYIEAKELSLKLLKLKEISAEQKDCIYYQLAIIDYYTNKFRSALRYINKCINIKKEDYKYSMRSMVYAKLNEIGSALKDCDLAIELNYNNDEFYRRKANCCNEMRLYKLAIENYKKAIELSGENEYDYGSLGYIYMKQGRYEEAIEQLTYFINKNRSYKQVYIDLADMQIKLLRYEDVVDTYSMFIQYNEEAPDMYWNRGEIFEYLGEYEKRDSDYIKAIELYKIKAEDEKNDWEIYNNIGILYEKLKKGEKAIEAYNKSILICSYNGCSYRNLGDVYSEIIKDYEKAIQCYRKQREISGENAELYFLEGKACLNAGKKDLGVKLLKKAIKSYSKYVKSNISTSYEYYNLGECYRLIGKKKKAITNFRYAIQAKECANCKVCICYEGYHRLGKIYEEMKKYKESFKYYSKVVKVNKHKEYVEDLIRVEKLLNS